MRSTHWSCALLLAMTVGCATGPSVRWFREDVHPVALRGRDRRLDQARIWTRDSLVQWRAVLITRDSISGVPYPLSEQCDGCRSALPVSAVDSLSVGYQSGGGGRGGGKRDDDSESPVWLPLLIFALIFCP